MIILKRGDKLPTVAVLQSYLNQQPSTPEFLVVDGVFGPRTEAAVIRFRDVTHLRKGKEADYAVWKRVVGADWQMIDSVDRSDYDDPKWATNEHEVLEPFGQTMLEFFGMSAGTPHVLRTIRANARPGEVALLRFHGHGSPGHMLVASGRLSTGSSFDRNYSKGFWLALQKFRGLFAPFGSIEMHGCRIGKGAAGHKLLSGMADAIGVPVTGGIQTQYGGSDSTFRFEGPTNTVCPNGESLRNWALRTGSVSRPRP
jgi:hypothetical protein